MPNRYGKSLIMAKIVERDLALGRTPTIVCGDVKETIAMLSRLLPGSLFVVKGADVITVHRPKNRGT